MHKSGVNDRLDMVDNDEQKLCEVMKHPFGIIIMYLQIAAGVIAVIVMSLILLPPIVNDANRAFGFALVISGIMMIISLAIILLATVVYSQNRLIVTDRNITQVLQYGLFNRKVSQLNLVNVEDVTSVQKGFLATFIGYGDLKIETAGEQVNFHFTYCPRPGYYAKIILDAREIILGQHENPSVSASRIVNM